MTQPYYTPPQPQQPPRPPDSRPLHRRKRVWAGGLLLLLVGSGIGASGDNNTAPVAAKPAVHVTTTATATVTATPKPAPTVTKTAKAKPAPTVTVTKTADSVDLGSSSSDNSASDSGTCSIRSNAGNCYSAGQYCRNSDHGATTTDASGTPITCSSSGSRWRWTY